MSRSDGGTLSAHHRRCARGRCGQRVGDPPRIPLGQGHAHGLQFRNAELELVGERPDDGANSRQRQVRVVRLSGRIRQESRRRHVGAASDASGRGELGRRRRRQHLPDVRQRIPLHTHRTLRFDRERRLRADRSVAQRVCRLVCARRVGSLRRPLLEPVHLHSVRDAVPARSPNAAPRRARRADGRRGRRRRRGDLDRQVRSGEGAVPLGPRGQERRPKLVLGARGPAVGRQAVGRRPHAPHRPGGDRRLRGGRTRTARSSSAASTMPSRCRRTRCPDNKTQSGIKTRSTQGRRRRELQRAALRGQERLRRSLPPGGEGPHRARQER